MNDDVRLDAGPDTSATQRAMLWQREVPKVFAGLRVVAGRDFAPAVLAVASCGNGRLAELAGGAHRVERRVAGRDASSDVSAPRVSISSSGMRTHSSSFSSPATSWLVATMGFSVG